MKGETSMSTDTTVLYFEALPAGLKRVVEDNLPVGWNLLTLSSDQDPQLNEKLEKADLMVVASRRVDGAILDRAKNLRMIQHQGVGFDNIDLNATRSRRIPIGLTPQGTSRSVAEHTILMILAISRSLIAADRSMRQGKWLQWELRSDSTDLAEKRLGLVGYGRIGRLVASRARPFETHLGIFDPYIDWGQVGPLEPDAHRFSNLIDLLAWSDIVSLHVPLTTNSFHMIGPVEIEAMQSSAILVNTARGGLVDYGALTDALERHRIRGAALDVFEDEPLSASSTLRHLDNVVLTPHISAGTIDCFRRKVEAIMDNFVRFSAGEQPRNLVEYGLIA